MAADGYGNAECFGKPEPGYGFASLASPASNATRRVCPPGSFNDGERLTCEKCPHGTAAATSGSLKCTPCPKGSFSGREGATSCESAPVGTYTDKEGAWKPTRCPPNHFADRSRSSSCQECPWPSFSLVGGGANCSLAEPGEIYEVVVWPRMTMAMASIRAEDVSDAAATGGSRTRLGNLDNLVSAWKASLAAYGVTNLELHLMALEPQTPWDDLLLVEFAVETVPPPLPKRKKKDDSVFQKLKARTEEVHKFVDSTRASFELFVDSAKNVEERNDRSGSNQDDDAFEIVVSTVQQPGFLEALLRQLHRQDVVDLSPRLVDITVFVDAPLKSSRAVKCPKGTHFFSEKKGDAKGTHHKDAPRECRLCPIGTYSDTLGVLACSPCPQGTFADEEGLEECWPCRSGGDAPPGSSACIECAFFTYACKGFWADVLLAVALVAALALKLWMRCKRLVRGDASTLQQSALLTAVRTHGRTSVVYEPMVRTARAHSSDLLSALVHG